MKTLKFFPWTPSHAHTCAHVHKNEYKHTIDKGKNLHAE